VPREVRLADVAGGSAVTVIAHGLLSRWTGVMDRVPVANATVGSHPRLQADGIIAAEDGNGARERRHLAQLGEERELGLVRERAPVLIDERIRYGHT
jgi:hypothetical protein